MHWRTKTEFALSLHSLFVTCHTLKTSGYIYLNGIWCFRWVEQARAKWNMVTYQGFMPDLILKKTWLSCCPIWTAFNVHCLQKKKDWTTCKYCFSFKKYFKTLKSPCFAVWADLQNLLFVSSLTMWGQQICLYLTMEKSFCIWWQESIIVNYNTCLFFWLHVSWEGNLLVL